MTKEPLELKKERVDDQRSVKAEKNMLNEQQKKATRNRALGVALVLAAFVLLIYLGALAKLGV